MAVGCSRRATGFPDELNELRLRHLDVLSGAMAELYSECFSDAQIQALLGSTETKWVRQLSTESAARFSA